jgi:hypothetical protein
LATTGVGAAGCCGLMDMDSVTHPRVPAIRPKVVVELLVSFDTEEHLLLAHRNDKANLRADADHPRFDGSDSRKRSLVGGKLLIEMANSAGESRL